MPICDSRKTNLRSSADALVEAQLFDSISWQLNQNSQSVSAGSSAQASLPQNPIYRIYSMTKPIVCLLALQLIERGELQLAAPVSSYIPAMASLKVINETNPNKVETISPGAMTIAHLLTHTAGFSYDFLPNSDVAQLYRDAEITGNGARSLEDYIAVLAELPLASQPGQAWRYSVSIDVLARVVEIASNRSLPELMAEKILNPLDMVDTGFSVANDKASRVLPMFGSRGLSGVMTQSTEPNVLTPLDVESSYPLNNAGFYRGGHGLYSTTEDYMQFVDLLHSGKTKDGQRLLSSAMLNMMWENRIPSALQPLYVGFSVLSGYGWNLMGRVMLNTGQADFLTAPGEGGWAGAASTYFWADRGNALSGVVMSQYIGSTTPLGLQMKAVSYGMLESA